MYPLPSEPDSRRRFSFLPALLLFRFLLAFPGPVSASFLHFFHAFPLLFPFLPSFLLLFLGVLLVSR